jgi:competence protein ComEA
MRREFKEGRATAMAEEFVQLDLNRADIKALTQLPGVGEVVAQRIIDLRPYADAEELLRVRGIGKASLARLKPYLRFEPHPEAGRGAEAASPGEAGEHTRPKRASETSETGPLPSRASPVQTWHTMLAGADPFWLMFGTALVSIVLSVFLSLAILGGINRTLDFGQHSAVSELRNSLEGLQSDLGDLDSRLASMDRRLEAVEGLSGQVKTLENEFATLREDVDQALLEMEATRAAVEQMAETVARLSERVGAFDSFLVGLEDLLTEVNQPSEPAGTGR